MTLTLQIPDEYAAFLPSKASDVAAVLSAGLRSWQGRKTGEILALDDVIETLADLPSAQEVLALHPSSQLAERTAVLLGKNIRQDWMRVSRRSGSRSCALSILCASPRPEPERNCRRHEHGTYSGRIAPAGAGQGWRTL